MRNVGLLGGFILLAVCSYSQIWNQVTVPTTENLLDVEFAPGSTTVGYIGGENGVLLKTTNGGQTWTEVTYTGINNVVPISFQDLEFVDENIGLATLGGTMGLYKTVDGGTSWAQLDDMEIGAFCYRNVLHVIDENHFFSAGAGCFQSAMIIEYNNGVWSTKNDEHETFSAMRGVRDIEFRGNLGIATVNDHLFLRTTDGGQNWDTIVSPVMYPNHLTDVFIINDTLMFAGHEEFSGQYLFFQSNDAGITWWNAQPTGGDIVFYSSWYAFESSANGDVYASASTLDDDHFMHEKNGNIWSYESIDQRIVSIDSYGNDVVYAVGDNGYVIVNSGVASLEEKTLDARVYPNPSDDLINIELDNVVPTQLNITDLSGKVIHEDVFTGSTSVHSADWTGGLYVITISTDTESTTLRHLVK
jgi:photosystem II stability/assembly factor-like uncharacterized protein